MDHRIGLGRDRRVVLQIGPRLDPEDVGQGQTPEPDRADCQETSAADRVTETIVCHRLVSLVWLFRGLARKLSRRSASASSSVLDHSVRLPEIRRGPYAVQIDDPARVAKSSRTS